MNGKRFLGAVAAVPASVLFAAVLLLAGLKVCGFSADRRPLVGGYYLFRMVGGTANYAYYLHAPSHPLDGGGIFDGTVHAIGWNDKWVVARVVRLASCDPNGWYLLDLQSGLVTGPLPKPLARHDERRWHIHVVSPAKVFKEKSAWSSIFTGSPLGCRVP